MREATTAGNGSATVAALPVAGVYSVVVTKSGFADQTLQAVTLRAGGTATLRVTLPVAGEKADVTVLGTREGVPIGAVQDMAALTNSFSAEFGWTAGPAVNVVTKTGSNMVRGEGLYLGRPAGTEAKTFSTTGLCPPSIKSCTVPTTLTSIAAADTPDVLHQISGTIGGPIAKDKTFFLASSICSTTSIPSDVRRRSMATPGPRIRRSGSWWP